MLTHSSRPASLGRTASLQILNKPISTIKSESLKKPLLALFVSSVPTLGGDWLFCLCSICPESLGSFRHCWPLGGIMVPPYRVVQAVIFSQQLLRHSAYFPCYIREHSKKEMMYVSRMLAASCEWYSGRNTSSELILAFGKIPFYQWKNRIIILVGGTLGCRRQNKSKSQIVYRYSNHNTLILCTLSAAPIPFLKVYFVFIIQ